MEKNKKIIIIGIIILIIAAVAIFLVLTSVNYERIYITPNGTSIEVPANETKFNGKIEGAKLWNWNNGVLITYNSYEDNNLIKVTELAFNALNQIIKNGEKQEIDGYTCYIINAEDLVEVHIFDVIKVNYKGKFYCIPLSNETTHDNLIICCNDKDMAIHMAKSIEYKNVYLKNNNLDSAISKVGNVTSKVENMTGDLQSIANDYVGDVDLNKLQSTIEDTAGDLLSKNQISV